MSLMGKGLISLSLVGVVLCLMGCEKKELAPTEPIIRPVKIFKVEMSEAGTIRHFPGRVEASQRADLAFRVSGTLNKLWVKEGDLVDKDQLLAELDDTDFKINVQDKQASYDKTKRNFERAKELIVSGYISKMDYDRMESDFKKDTAALANAKQQLAYTQLAAPFAGQVARRFVDNFEEIAAKQDVFALQGVNSLDVVINIPESIVRNLRASAVEERKRNLTVYAEFDGKKEHHFPLQVKEIATKADPDTQTFQVRLTMPSPNVFTVLPGMTVSVVIDFSKFTQAEPVFWIPSSAVVANSVLGSQVWVLDPDTMTVSAKAVKVGRMKRDQIQVTEGLSGNEEIVAVGAAYLAQGMTVSRMPQSEQAIPRTGEPNQKQAEGE
ncbi:efflux RND transporter periplasmic adaptor subunit [Shewanella surugensis]|uniref:Efflux RND transporter periplasmic adaptor subunit n=1 Tax=Shewanella surugensis TaxID=212020 RepID=A0ABT0L8S4_9GAMM|nr:efflux RND transporter periplasmic adaptor subunit [Shewanella surugensis]MCL1123775.1 efflux RND transporter periplasmic adaptor subunit [Shewanella surugensis]